MYTQLPMIEQSAIRTIIQPPLTISDMTVIV